MALKTFNLDAQVYEEFSKHCKQHGISMSRKIENFIKQELNGLKMKKGDFILEVEKDVMKKPGLEAPKQDEHPLSKYC